MKELTIIKQNGTLLTDSREVAEITGMRHDNLLTKIKGYSNILDSSKLRSQDFFIESTYLNNQNKEQPCYLLSKKGCDMVANKMTGEKGILFTAAYVTKFEEMENQANKPMCLEDLIIMQANSVKDLKEKVDLIEDKTKTLSERISNLDKIDVKGTPRQRLKTTVDKYSMNKGVTFSTGWNEFKSNFNTAYHTNIENKKKHYLAKNKIKNLTNPEFLERIGLLDDALRVADKMLNEVVR